MAFLLGIYFHLETYKLVSIPADDPNRARNSLPEGLVIRKSRIDGAGEGIFSTSLQPKGIRYGPYEGCLIKDPAVAYESG